VIEYLEARRRLIALASPLANETLPIANCFGRYLGTNIYAKRTQPAADLSAMDGYAIRYAEIHNRLEIVGESAAGKPFAGTLKANEAVRIFTGAHIPCGADTVIIQEDVIVDEAGITKSGDGPEKMGAHIRRSGTDFRRGELLLAKGQLLNAGSIAASAMGGYGALNVGQIPKIAVIGSGDELVPPGAETSTAQIPSSNNSMLCALLSSLCCNVSDAGVAADNLAAIEDKLRACADADIIVTSGGASVGDHDLVRAALINIGAEIDFWRVAVKPGKPIMAGRLGKSIVLGLPGNPGSAYVTAFLFLLPLVRHLAGSVKPWPLSYSSTLLAGLPATKERTEFLRATVDANGITTLSAQDSGLTATLASANALLVRPAFAPSVSPGELVQYHLL
jgi:molybdopterin molybdotransferase